MPNTMRIAHYGVRETIIYLGGATENEKMTICVGIGLVKMIQKGTDFDLVGMDFGRGFIREIYVKNNHARRQIYTLKKGQYAWFYGFVQYYKDNGKSKASFFAKAFQGWYVPKSMDIIKVDPTEIDKLTEENESKINFIDELIKGANEDD